MSKKWAREKNLRGIFRQKNLKSGGLLRPPFRCRVPNRGKNRPLPYSPKGFRVLTPSDKVAVGGGKSLKKKYFFAFLLTNITLSATLLTTFEKRRIRMATEKKRVTISLSDERYAEFEKLVKESGLTKSTLVTSWILKEIEKGQVK